MTICYIHWKDQEGEHNEECYSLRDAKKLMKQHQNSTGSKIKVYSNGDWINCGKIELKRSNKSFIANSPKNMNNSNY